VERGTDLFETVIITKDSHKTIDIVLTFWRSLGIDPLVLVDDASAQNTFEVLRRISARHVPVTNNARFFKRGEQLVQRLREFTNAPWILRLDDDELPNVRMIEWVRKVLDEPITNWSVGFERRQVTFRKGRLHYAAGEPVITTWKDDYFDIQWRLFQPDLVKYTDEIHTPGYFNENWILAPKGCYITHFEWITQSYAQRKVKMARYEAEKKGSSFPKLSLYEDFDAAIYQFTPLEDREFDYVGYELGLRCGNLPVPLSLSD